MPPANTLRGIVVMGASSMTLPLSDALAKHLIVDHSAVQILWMRYFVVMVGIGLAILARRRVALFATKRPGLHLLRAGITLVMSLLMIWALRFIPVADAIAILFVGPLIVVALSVPLLGERVGILRWSAVIAGFIGVLVIMRPGLGIMHWAASLAFFSAVMSALQAVVTRKLVATEHVFTTLFYMGSLILVMLTPIVPFMWTPLTWSTFTMLILIGLISIVGQLGLVKATEYAPISVLAPFSYFQIISATIVGYLAFGDLPDVMTILGMMVVIASGLYVGYREQQLAAHARAHPI